MYGRDARKYYEGENPAIMRYEKILTDALGNSHTDRWSANHKIPSNFFGTELDQEVQYLLGNGIDFGNEKTSLKLGIDFVEKVSDLLEDAGVDGTSYAFWNLDHIEVFPFCDTEIDAGFVPLKDESTSELRAGISYYQIDNTKPLNVTLYEEDGYTKYLKDVDENSNMVVKQEKRPYKVTSTKSKADGEVITPLGNYSRLPIFELRYRKNGKSALTGKKNTIDALDLATSDMINNVSEGNLIYWVLENCNGMDDLDDSKFLKELKTSHIVHADGDDGAKVNPVTVDVPVDAIKESIATLTRRLYTDFQAFDSSIVSAGNQTATAIKACYVPLDLKVDKTEKQVTKFILQLLNFLGIEDKPSFTRNQVINKNEETQNILLGAEYYDDEYITRKLLAVNGDLDQFDELQKRKTEDESNRFNVADDEITDENTDDLDANSTEEAIDIAEDKAGKTLNGAQTQSLIAVMQQYSAGSLTEGQAVAIISTAIGVSKDEARAIIKGE